MGVGCARWNTADGGLITAIVSSHYTFQNPRKSLATFQPQLRTFSVQSQLKGNSFIGEFETCVKSMGK